MTIKEFFEIYDKYCINNEQFACYNDKPDKFTDYYGPKTGIYEKAGKFYWEISRIEDIENFPTEYNNESNCVYQYMRTFHGLLLAQGFPEFKLIKSDNMEVGVIIKNKDNINDYIAYCGNKTRMLIPCSKFNEAIEIFWNYVGSNTEALTDLTDFQIKIINERKRLQDI